jgi:excisionase family DNA binding protein
MSKLEPITPQDALASALSTVRAAEHLGVHADTLRRWVVAGEITPSFKTPGGHLRFTLADLTAWQQKARAIG